MPDTLITFGLATITTLAVFAVGYADGRRTARVDDHEGVAGELRWMTAQRDTWRATAHALHKSVDPSAALNMLAADRDDPEGGSGPSGLAYTNGAA